MMDLEAAAKAFPSMIRQPDLEQFRGTPELGCRLVSHWAPARTPVVADSTVVQTSAVVRVDQSWREETPEVVAPGRHRRSWLAHSGFTEKRRPGNSRTMAGPVPGMRWTGTNVNIQRLMPLTCGDLMSTSFHPDFKRIGVGSRK